MKKLHPPYLEAALSATDTTHTALAEAAGISRPRINQYLSDPSDPDASVVLAFAREMEIPPESLLEEYDGEPGISISAAVEIEEAHGIGLEDLCGQ